MNKLSNEDLLIELQAPFPLSQVQWRVTNTASNRTRGQVVPYADPRAYTDRLNSLVTPQGWTRSYETTTMNNITRTKRNSEVVTGKILVICKVTIDGLGTHSGTGEEWADGDNAMTAAEAQAFKRACSCFGLGRYFYDFEAPWVDLDDRGRPKKLPAVPAWIIPENWRKGMRSSGKSARVNGNSHPTTAAVPANGRSKQNGSSDRAAPARSNGKHETVDGKPQTGIIQNGADLDKRIAALEDSVGGKLYRWVLREYGRANHPHLVRDVQQKKKILNVLESATRGLRRMEAVLDRIPEGEVSALLSKLQAPPLNEIADMPTLVHLLNNGSHPSAA